MGTTTTPFAVKANDYFYPSFNTNLKGNMPLQRTIGSLFPLSSAGILGCWLLALVPVFSVPLPPALAQSGPFAGFAGRWSGAGTLRPENGTAERIRCNANYSPGSTQREIDLQLRCASDSYNFDLTGQFTADDQNQISGRWTERSRGTGGTAVGNAQGDRLQLHIESAGFAADLVMVTRNRRQSVDIDSHGGGQIVKASITLSRS
jgi:hypothetical protein